MGQIVVFEATLSESAAGEVEFTGAGRGSYVLSASVTSGGPVGFRLYVGELSVSGWSEITPASNPCGALAAGDAASFSASAGSWPRLKLAWDAAFDGTVSLVASR